MAVKPNGGKEINYFAIRVEALDKENKERNK